MTKQMWMVRAGRGGRQAVEFREKELVGIGWENRGDLRHFPDKAALVEAYREGYPDWSEGRLQGAASQLIRFRDELSPGDRVLTYDSSRRIYHVGTLAGDYAFDPDVLPPCENVRAVKWEAELDRDRLSLSARNSLGSTLTLFRVPDGVQAELETLVAGRTPEERAVPVAEDGEDESALLLRYREEAVEIVKDRGSGWAPMRCRAWWRACFARWATRHANLPRGRIAGWT